MAEKLELQIEARFGDTNETLEHFCWPSRSTTSGTVGETLTETPDEGWCQRIECATGGGETIAISNFASVTYLMVKNLDSSNFISVTHDNAAAATVVTKVLAGQVYITPDCDPSATFKITADTAAVLCKVAVVGS